MLPVDRRHRILERVAEQQTIHIAELALELGVSEMTIRRDITRLEQDGFLRRTYGGATAHITRSMELALQRPRPPARAGEAAHRDASGSGSTWRPARCLRRDRLRRPSSSSLFLPDRGTSYGHHRLAAGRQPARDPAAATSSCSAAPSSTDELACVGPVAAATLRRYHADVAVLGAAGLTAGVRHHRARRRGRPRSNALTIERSDRLIVIADGSKLGSGRRRGRRPGEHDSTRSSRIRAPRPTSSKRCDASASRLRSWIASSPQTAAARTLCQAKEE